MHKPKRILYRGAVYRRVGNSRVTWTEPNLRAETKEYFETPFIQETLAEYGRTFKTDDEVLEFLQKGTLTDATRSTFGDDEESARHMDEAFEKYLEDPEYAVSFRSMEKSLKEGNLVLPAPVFIRFEDGFFLGYSGQRRTNLAWRYNLPLKIWLVNASN